MALPPIPGASEASLIAQVSARLISGLRQANQVPPWPNVQSSLFELVAILDEWRRRAERTAFYADEFLRESSFRSSSLPVGSNVSFYADSNVARSYALEMVQDSRRVLDGSIPFLWRFSKRRRRRAVRHGLRPILLAYCPNLLEQFEQATTARVNWVEQYGKGLDHWFDGSHTVEQTTELVEQMKATELGLENALNELQKFITENFPIGGRDRPT